MVAGGGDCCLLLSPSFQSIAKLPQFSEQIAGLATHEGPCAHNASCRAPPEAHTQALRPQLGPPVHHVTPLHSLHSLEPSVISIVVATTQTKLKLGLTFSWQRQEEQSRWILDVCNAGEAGRGEVEEQGRKPFPEPRFPRQAATAAPDRARAEDGAWVHGWDGRQDRMELLHQPHRVPHPCMWKLPAFFPPPETIRYAVAHAAAGHFSRGYFWRTGKRARWDEMGGSPSNAHRETDRQRRDRTGQPLLFWMSLVWTLSGTSRQPETGKQPVDSRLAPSPARLCVVRLCVLCVSSPSCSNPGQIPPTPRIVDQDATRFFFAQILDEFNGGMRSDSSHRPDQRHTVRRAAGTSLGSILAIRLPATGSIRTAMQLPGSGTSTGRTRCRRGGER